MSDQLLVGSAESDITPPIGTELCGSLRPRVSDGIDDPLLVKAVVIESEGVEMAMGVFDLTMLTQDVGDEAIRLAAEATGIAADNMLWATTQTHSGPYTVDFFEETMGAKVDRAYLDTLPGKFATAVAAAQAAKKPARMSRMRGYEHATAHNRRLRFKGGRQLNTWLLNRGEEDLQCLGTAGPVDPELGVIAFDDMNGNLIAILFHFTLHVNTHFGTHLSADFPAVVASRMREHFGPQVVTLHLPGCSGDINKTIMTYREVGDRLANVMVPLLRGRQPLAGPLLLAVCKREITVSYRDFSIDQEQRIEESQWDPASKEFFRRELAVMRREGITEAVAPLAVWRLGDVSFAHIPGELFVECGLQIKEHSPFPWTFPVELAGGYLGYLVTPSAWDAGGYESLISRVGNIDVAGVESMVSTELTMLRELHEGAAGE